MNTVGKVLSAPLKLTGIVPKMPKLPAPAATVTRDDAAASVATTDELRRRRGGAADILTGASGAEAATGAGKALLGS